MNFRCGNSRPFLKDGRKIYIRRIEPIDFPLSGRYIFHSLLFKSSHTSSHTFDASQVKVYGAFRDALKAENVEEGLSLYPIMKLLNLLDSESFAGLARILHNRYRLSRDKDEKSQLTGHAQVMAKDLQQGNAPPSPEGSLRLISFFKEAKLRTEGLQFWNWLVKQSDEYVDARVYGAAIELLARFGESLDTIEALYSQGMKRYPSGFIEYHLAPYAVLFQPGKLHHIKGLSQSLLQGIITARLMLGDIYGAYLGLDTALRLFSYQMLPRICEIFVRSRSIPEAYKVLLTAIRTGVRLKAPVLRILQTRMTYWQESTRSYSDKLQLAERSLNAFYAYVASGNQLFYTNANLLVKTLTKLMSPSRPIDMELSDFIEFRNEIRKTLSESTFETIETIIEGGMIEAQISVYNTLISMAGRSKNRVLFGKILKQIESHDLKPDDVTYRVVLTAAGLLKDAEIVKSTWNILADKFVIEGGTKVAHENRFRLLQACKSAGCMGFYHTQVGGSKSKDVDGGDATAAGNQHELNDSEARTDTAAISPESAKQSSGKTELTDDLIPKMTPEDQHEIRSRVQHLKGQMEAICEVARGVQRPSLYEIPISIDMTELPTAVTNIVSPSRRVMRAVYEELITDPYRSLWDRLNAEKASKKKLLTDFPVESPAVPPHKGSHVEGQVMSDSSISEPLASPSSTLKSPSTNISTMDISSAVDQPSPLRGNAEPEPKPDATSTTLATSKTYTSVPNPNSPTPEPKPKPEPKTPTGYPLSEIRFANWLSLTELLLVARVEQKRQQAVIDRAIALGTSVPLAMRRSDEYSPSKMMKDPDQVGIFDGFKEGGKASEEGEKEEGKDHDDAKYDEVVDMVEVAQVKKRVAPLRYAEAGSATATAADATTTADAATTASAR